MVEPAIAKSCDPEDIQYRVLLAVPEARTIPIFALGVESKRPRIETEVLPPRRLSSMVSGNVFRSLQTRYGLHRLVRVRRRVSERTAIYSSWLAFPAQEPAQAFLEANRRFGLDAMETKTDADLLSTEIKLDEAVKSARYDLSRIDHRARLGRAQEYVATAEKLDKLGWARWSLAKLREDLAAVPEEVSVG